MNQGTHSGFVVFRRTWKYNSVHVRLPLEMNQLNFRVFCVQIELFRNSLKKRINHDLGGLIYLIFIYVFYYFIFFFLFFK